MEALGVVERMEIMAGLVMLERKVLVALVTHHLQTHRKVTMVALAMLALLAVMDQAVEVEALVR
jgi:hypothetical protein